MRVHFWGVRGSIPAPLTPSQIKNKISAVIQRISVSDLKNSDTRERFMATLPDWLFGTVGSNTPCVEVETKNNDRIIFDAGTGLRELGIDLMHRSDYKTNNTFHIFLSHFHWDHIQGLPFFNPAYDANNKIILYSTKKDIEKFLINQMVYPYFPIPMLGEDGFGAKIEFRHIKPDEKYIHIGNAKVGWHRVRHPGGCTAFSVIDENRKIIYSTDTELRERDFEKNVQNTEFYTNAEMIIIDAQYTLSDSIQKAGWGHSTYSTAIEFAAQWGIKSIALFHHEPTYNDKKIFSLKKSADMYRDRAGIDGLNIFVSQEGQDIYI